MNRLWSFNAANKARAGSMRALLLLIILSMGEGTAPGQTRRAAPTPAAHRLAAEATSLYQTGSKESLTQAVGKFAQAAQLYKAAKQPSPAGIMLNYIGKIYQALGEPKKALVYFEQSLPLSRAADDRGQLTTTLNDLGTIYDELGEPQKALDFYEQSLNLSRALGDRKSEANTLNNIGSIYFTLGAMEKSLAYSTQALKGARAAGDQLREVNALLNIGSIHSAMGEQRQALENFAPALQILRAAGNRSGEAAVLNNMGGAYDELGEKRQASERYTQALSLARAVGDRSAEANILNNLGSLCQSLGEHQKALDHYGQALSMRREIGDRNGEANTLNNLAGLYFVLGESERSLDYFTQTLALYRAVKHSNGEAVTLNNLGLVALNMGERPQAVSYFEQSLPLLRAVKNRRVEATTLGNIGGVYADLGDAPKALDYHTQALNITRDIGDRGGEANALHNLGLIYTDAGDRQKALDHYTQALSLRRAVGDRGGEGTALYSLAYEARERGDLTEARARIEEALTILESLRADITSRRLRSSYFASVQQYYEFYIDLLMRLHKQSPIAGFDGAALQAAERARARVLLDTLTEAGANIREGIDPGLAERERAAQKLLNAAAEKRRRIMSGTDTEARVAAAAAEVTARAAELEQIETEIRQNSPRYAALTQPQPLALREIQAEALDAETLLLEYALGEKGSFVWAVTKDSIASYELPKRAEIEEAAREVYALLNSPEAWAPGAISGPVKSVEPGQPQRGIAAGGTQAGSQSAMLRLSRMILAPLAARLGEKRLLIVADGALQFIPFGALQDPTAKEPATGYEPLIVKHEIVNLPSASTLAVLRRELKDRPPAAKTVAVLADPVFDRNDERVRSRAAKASAARLQPPPTRGLALVDDRVKKAAQQTGAWRNRPSAPRLPGTRQEATQIAGLAPAAERKEALDFAASRETMTDAELGNYRYVHLATHGFLDSEQPELSGILLSMVNERGEPQDGFFRAHEVYNLKLSADMVVLSACATGLGKQIRGEGLVGLTRGFMYAGAPRVVVSLWNVSDAATAELMTRFYKGLLVDKLRPARALQAAQASMIADKRFAAPFYWAAFTLQGEWR